MSGHSKWATTKYRKGAQDSARAKVFAKIIRQVEVAARAESWAPFRYLVVAHLECPDIA